MATLFGLMAVPALSQAEESAAAPDGWKFVTVRDETAAKSFVSREGDQVGLIITGNGQATGDGSNRCRFRRVSTSASPRVIAPRTSR